MDFYIFWKLRFCRTPPSTRQLFYPLVNLSLTSHLPIPFLSIHISSLHSPFPNPTFIQISLLLFKYPPTLIPHPLSHISSYSSPLLIHNLSTTHTQVIHSFSTSYPQPSTLLIDLSSILLFPLILLFLQSSPLQFLLYPHPKLSTGTLSYPQVIHNLVYLSTGYPQIYPTYLTFKPTLTTTQ